MQWILNDKKERQQIGQKFATLRIIYFFATTVNRKSINYRKENNLNFLSNQNEQYVV